MHTRNPTPLPAPPRVLIPLASSSIPERFRSSATDYTEKFLDLNELIIKCIKSTFFMRVGGVSMVMFGINDRDLKNLDRAAPSPYSCRNASIGFSRAD